MARVMKDSGVEWIGQMPKSWHVFPAQRGFTEIKRKNTDGAVKKALQFKFGTIIPKTNFDAESDDYVADTITTYNIVDSGTVMINGLNLNYDFKTQRSALVKETGVITSAYLALWPDTTVIIPEYATYLFKGYEAKMALHNMGSGIRLTLGWKEFKKQPVLFPSIPEQQLIVSFLDLRCAEIDSAIAETQRTIEEYKKLKQSIITEAVTKGVRGDRAMKDSGIEWIGEIPVEWDMIPLQYFVELNKYVLGEETSPDYEFEYVEIGAVTLEKGIYEYQHYKFADAPSRARRIVQPNDIIISTVRTYLKAIAIVPEKENVIVSTGFAVLTPRNICIDYLGFALKSEYFVHMVSANSVGISYPAINSSDLVKFKITIPPREEQKEIANYLNQKCTEIDRLIDKKTQLLSELETYKKSVIYEYVTGKKEVPACQ